MNKFLILAVFLTIISCDKKNNEKLYEGEKITIIYKENKSIFSEKLISIQFESKDTLIHTKNHSFEVINELLINALDEPKKEIDYLDTKKYDLLLIKKDSLVTTDKIYKEFKKFLLNENIVKEN